MIKSKRVGLIFAAAIFLVGLVCGMFMDRIFMFRRMFPFPMKMNQKQEDRMANRMMNGLSRRLALTEEQKNKLTPIFKQHKEEMDALAKTIRPKFEALKNKMNTEIKSILSDEQKNKFEKMFKGKDSQHKMHEGPKKHDF